MRTFCVFVAGIGGGAAGTLIGIRIWLTMRWREKG
jgi:hypothetical protein